VNHFLQHFKLIVSYSVSCDVNRILFLFEEITYKMYLCFRSDLKHKTGLGNTILKYKENPYIYCFTKDGKLKKRSRVTQQVI